MTDGASAILVQHRRLRKCPAIVPSFASNTKYSQNGNTYCGEKDAKFRLADYVGTQNFTIFVTCAV
jgi:hypothetical protein